MGESGSLPERRGDSPETCDGDGGAAGNCILLSFSSVEKETVFLRFLRGGTRTIGDVGRGYGGEGGCLVGAVVSALPSFVSPEKRYKFSKIELELKLLCYWCFLVIYNNF